ncbi:MAG: ABC transporter ATP-binding protein [Bacteroidetes bacterium]|nr:MAG: ABC transporter ATP-binding protein [Bacteroidota bacterium]
MTISLTNTGKRFNRDWIFRHFDFQFIPDKHYAITGPNGSGKSTLLQCIAGAIALSEGKINCRDDVSQKEIPSDSIFKFISIAAPYLELVEEMTLLEFLKFHNQFKPLVSTESFETIMETLGLAGASSKQIRYFSSGMKQRLKLGQAFFSATPVILLDEPCTNLDNQGIELYDTLVAKFSKGRMIIVSSNDQREYQFCEKIIDIRDYKKSN